MTSDCTCGDIENKECERWYIYGPSHVIACSEYIHVMRGAI